MAFVYVYLNLFFLGRQNENNKQNFRAEFNYGKIFFKFSSSFMLLTEGGGSFG